MLLKNHDKIAMVWGDYEISYKVLLQKISFYSSLFYDAQTEKIAIFSENRMEWVFAFFAAWKNGVTVIPIDFMATPEEVAYILNDCKPEKIFCSEKNHEVLKEAVSISETAPSITVFESIVDKYEEFEADSIEEFPKNDVAVIIYTSGTTGSPKGVMLTYNNLASNVKAVSESVPIYTASQRVMVLLPLHHIFPLMGSLIAPLMTGGTIIFSPSIKADDISSTLQNHKVTMVIGVPRLYSAMMKGIKDRINKSFLARKLYFIASEIGSKTVSKIIFRKVHKKFGGCIKYFISGGAAIDVEVEKCFSTLGFELLTGYGMSETAPMMTFTRPGNAKLGSCGQEIYPDTLAIRDGEVVAHGNNVMKGYFNRPEETADVIKDGWLHTGDIGYIDNDGFLFITGRKKEIIVLPTGKNINPEEVEYKIIGMNESIKEIGVYMKNGVICAVILPDFHKLKKAGIVNLDEYYKWEVIDKFNKSVSPYKRIMKFNLVSEELPRTRIGKLKRFQLENFSKTIKTEKKKEKEPDTEEYKIIKEYLEKATSKEVEIDDHLEIDLGMDSLDKVSFQVFLQNSFGVKLREDELANYSTLKKVVDFISSEKKKIEKEDFDWNEVINRDIDIDLPKSIFTFVLIKNISRFFLSVFLKMDVKGLENLPDSPFIFAVNHQSFIDGLFVGSFLKNSTLKNTYFFAKAKHFNSSYKHYLAMRNNIIIMDIQKDLQESIQKMAEVLKRKKNIIIFPEGTRTVNGDLGEFKKTFAILSKELNVPVVPVAINHAFKVLPKGAVFPRLFKKVSVNYLAPVEPGNNDYNACCDIVKKKIFEVL